MCMWVMIVVHFIGFIVGYFNTFLSANYREINQDGFDVRPHYKWFTVGALIGFSVATGLAFWLETIVKFPEANEACSAEKRRSFSIILLWLWADVLISYFSIASVFLDFYLGRQ